MTAQELIKSIPPAALEQLSYMLLGMMIGMLAGVLIALDARDMGAPKPACVMWFFCVSMFIPFVFVYLIFRIAIEKKVGAAGAVIDTQPVVKNQTACPYCKAQLLQGARLCPRCGRLL